ncbi:MAG: hypothetical protein KA314_04755 [Chloroflexi bacterium]|nr:hypothetical protein [Chloroflexota bacterium]
MKNNTGRRTDDVGDQCEEFLKDLSRKEIQTIIHKLRIGNDASEELLYGWKTMNDETVAYFLSICQLSFATLLAELEKFEATNEQ